MPSLRFAAAAFGLAAGAAAPAFALPLSAAADPAAPRPVLGYSSPFSSQEAAVGTALDDWRAVNRAVGEVAGHAGALAGGGPAEADASAASGAASDPHAGHRH